MQVYECMTANPITISPKATCEDALRLLRIEKVLALPVIGNNGKLVGILTERDLPGISQFIVPEMPTVVHNLDALQIESVMTREVVSVQEDCGLEEAARILIDHKISSLPVMRGDQLVGMVTEKDIFRTMMEVLGGRSEGLSITFQLLEDNGELGAVTDGIIQLGGKLICLSTYWGISSFQRVITLKVQGIHREELLLLLETTIGVRVLNWSMSHFEHNACPMLPRAGGELFPVSQIDTNIPWPLEPK